MRKVLTMAHAYKMDSYNVDSVEQMNKDVAGMLEHVASMNVDDMICVIIRRKVSNDSYRVSALAVSDIDAEEFIVQDGAIDKLIIQGRE